MYLQGPNINKTGNSGRRNPSSDSIMALIVGVPTLTVTPPVDEGESVKLIQTSDAENAGITASFDSTNSVLARAHVDEFFRLCPEGTLYVTFVDNSDLANFDSNTLADLVVALKMTFGDAINDIKSFAIAHNDTSFELADVIGQIPFCQSLVDELRSEFIYVDSVLIEGFAADDTAISAYPSLRALDSENISLVVGQDSAIGIAKSSCVGAALGMLAQRNVNESLGSVDIQNKPNAKKGDRDYSLTDLGLSKFLGGVLNDKNVNELTAPEKKALADAGYIFIGGYPGYSGLFFNGDNTCTDTASKYRFIHANRIWNKAARLLREAFIPQMESVLKMNPKTGFLKETTTKALEAIGEKAVNDVMGTYISGFEVYINPEQTPSPEDALVVSMKLVKDGILHEMDIDFALTNDLN